MVKSRIIKNFSSQYKISQAEDARYREDYRDKVTRGKRKRRREIGRGEVEVENFATSSTRARNARLEERKRGGRGESASNRVNINSTVGRHINANLADISPVCPSPSSSRRPASAAIILSGTEVGTPSSVLSAPSRVTHTPRLGDTRVRT